MYSQIHKMTYKQTPCVGPLKYDLKTRAEVLTIVTPCSVVISPANSRNQDATKNLEGTDA